MGRRAARLIALALIVVAAGAVLADVADSWRYHDLWCFYQGGNAVRVGVDPYDNATWDALTADPSRFTGPRLIKAPCPGAFAYPYWSAIAFVPLALWRYEVAAIVWGALLIVGVVGGVALVIRATHAPALLVAVIAAGSLSTMRVLVLGQLTGVLFPLVGLSLLAPASNAGVAAALLYLKPQLGGLYVPALMWRSDRHGMRFSWAVAATAVALAALSIVAFPSWPKEWLHELTTNRAEMARPLPTAAGLAIQMFGDASFAVVLIAALVAAIVVLARGRRIDRVAYAAIAMGVSLFAVPYAYSYDQLFLLLPWAVVAAAAARAAGLRRHLVLVALVCAAVVLPWAIFVATFDTGGDTLNAIVPALAAILVTVVLPRRAGDGGSRRRGPQPSRG